MNPLRKGKSGAANKARGPVKVPKGPVGRMVFFGGQAGAALAAARVIKDARARGDRLALAHGVLTAAILAVTGALAVRSVKDAKAEQVAPDEMIEPRLLASGGK